MPTDRSVLVRLKASTGDFVSGMRIAKAAVGDLRNEIDTTNDRTAWLAQGILAIGPALSPIGAAAVPIFSGLVTQMTLAAGAAGVMVAGFQGVGDSLGALNDYQLEPTADNFNKLQLELEKIGPAGEEFVRFLDSVGPQFAELQMLSREGMFPGMEDGIESLLTMMPQLERVTTEVAQAIGELSSDAGEGLAGPRFREFFDYLERDAKGLLIEMGQTVGNFIDGIGAMIVAFGPLTAQFSSGFESMSKSFADWAHGLDESASFARFVGYVQDSIPMVKDLIASLSDAFVAIVVAAAPVGDVMVPALSALFDIVTKVANTPLGPVFIGAAAAMSLYGRAAALASITTGGLAGKVIANSAAMKVYKSTAAGALPTIGQFGTVMFRAGQSADNASAKTAAARSAVSGLRPAFGQAAAGAGLFALAMTDVDEQLGISNTAMGLLAGAMIGGPLGAGIGAVVGGFADLSREGKTASDSLDMVRDAADRLDFKTARQGIRDIRAELESYADPDLSDKIANTAAEIGHLFNSVMGGDFTPGLRSDVITDQLGKAREAVRNTRLAMKGAGDEGIFFGDALRLSAEGARAAAAGAEEFSRSLGRLNRMLEGRANMRDYEAALDDFTAGLAENGRTMDINTAKGRANEEALDNIAGTALRVAENLKGTARVEVLTRARGDVLEMIEKLDLSGGALKRAMRLVDQLDKAGASPKVEADTAKADQALKKTKGKVDELGWLVAQPRVDAKTKEADGAFADLYRAGVDLDKLRPTPKVSVDTGGVLAQINAVRSWLNGIPDEQVNIRVVRTGAGGQSGGYDGVADGGTIPGQRQPYGDKHLYMLAPGEEVISNRRGQADRFRPLLKAINNAADGATVGGRSAFGLGASVFPDEMREFARATELSRRGLLAELRVRARLLDKDLEAHKSRLDALKSERDSIAATVKARLDSDIFARDEREYMQLARPENWNELSPEAQRSHLEAEWAVNQSLGFGQSQSPEDRMRAQQAEAKRMLELIRSLKNNGLNGSALAALLAEGDDAQLALYAGDKAASRRYERMYNQTERLTSRVGDAAGNAAYGRAISEQTAEVRELRKEAQQTNRRLERIEKATSETGPDRTARGVASAVNGAAAAGQRRRV